MTQSSFNPTESENSLMDYIDDGDSESELLGPVQVSGKDGPHIRIT